MAEAANTQHRVTKVAHEAGSLAAEEAMQAAIVAAEKGAEMHNAALQALETMKMASLALKAAH